MVGLPVRIAIDDFICDEEIDEHFARHDVGLENVLAVAGSEVLTFENLPGRRGTHIMIGRTKGAASSIPASSRPSRLGFGSQ